VVRGERSPLRARACQERTLALDSAASWRSPKPASRDGKAGADLSRADLSDTKELEAAERRVVAKAEHIAGKANPRFVVRRAIERADAATLYEKVYCARGDMENESRTQSPLRDARARTQCAPISWRLIFQLDGYILLNELRRGGLEHQARAPRTSGPSACACSRSRPS